MNTSAQMGDSIAHSRSAYGQAIDVAHSVTLPRLLDQKELAGYLGKSIAWCERARWAGEGPKFIKLGRCVRYRADDLLAWIEANSSVKAEG